MCMSLSQSTHHVTAAVATACAGCLNGFTAGRSANGGDDDRGSDMQNCRGSPPWCCQPSARFEGPFGGVSLRAKGRFAYYHTDYCSACPIARWAQRPTPGHCRHPRQHDWQRTGPFMLPLQPATCPCFRRTGRAPEGRGGARRNDAGKASRPRFFCHVSRRPSASRLGRSGRDTMPFSRFGRDRLAQWQDAVIQGASSRAHVTVEQSDPCSNRDRCNDPVVARSRNGVAAVKVERLLPAGRQAACRRWGRKAVSRMGAVTSPRSLGGEPSRFEGAGA